MHLLTFLLDHPDENLDSSIDLFNLPSTQLVSGYKGEDLFIHAFTQMEKFGIIKTLEN